MGYLWFEIVTGPRFATENYYIDFPEFGKTPDASSTRIKLNSW